jgi:thiol-disulfide isomerase/thioredoxin
MKNKILKSSLLALVLIGTILSCSKKVEGYTINGTIDGQKEGMLYLNFLDVAQTVLKDSTKIVDGHFTFEGVVDQPLKYSINLKGQDPYGIFILANETIEFKAKKDSFYAAEVSGATEDSIYKSYYKNEGKKISVFEEVVYKAFDSVSQKGKVKLTPEQKVMMDKRFADLKTFSDDLTDKFIKSHKNQVAAALVMDDRIAYYDPTPEKVEEYYAILSPELQNSFFGKKLKTTIELNKKTAIGATALEFSQPDVNGKIIKLSDYKGKYVFVDFWASWCGPCRRENPYVEAAYKKYHDKGFNVLSVSLDNKKELWEKAIEEDGLPWTHVSDLKGFKNNVAILYGVKLIPTNYLIGPDGKIIAKNLREEALESKLKEIFSKLEYSSIKL